MYSSTNKNNAHMYLLTNRKTFRTRAIGGGGGGSSSGYYSSPSVPFGAATATSTLVANYPQQQQQQQPQTTASKSSWGSATWYLLHTLSFKLKDTVSSDKRKELLDLLFQICTNLPCPDCSNHSLTYLTSIGYLKRLYTKEEMKKVFFDFHNNVNRRKGYALYMHEQFDDKYSLSVTKNVIGYFLQLFRGNSKVPKLMSDNLHRQALNASLRNWFSANIALFDE